MIRFLPIETKAVEELIRQEALASPHPWSNNDLRTSMASRADCCVIERDGKTAGYYVVQRVLDEAELLNIVVFIDYQSKGYGYEALTKMQSSLLDSGIKTLFLEVRASNIPARSLYLKAGFEVVDIRKGYYGPGRRGGESEDAIVMRCCLA